MAACKGMVKTLVKLLLFLPLALLVVCVNFQVDVSGLFQGDQFEREIAQKLLEGESISHFEKLDERQILRLYIQNMPQRYDTLVVGSSRGLQITKEIAGCDGLFYNAGMTGEDYADILCTISWLVRYDRLPEHMIMVLDPWILSANKDAKGKYSDQNTANEFLATVLGFDVAYTPNTTPFYTEALFSLDYFQGNIAYYFGDHSGEDRPSVVEGDVYDQATEIKMSDGTLLYTREFREQSQQAVDNDAAFRATMPFIMCDQYPVPDQTLTEQFTALVDFLQGQGVEGVSVGEVAALVAVADEPAHEVDGVDGLVDDGAAALHLPSALPVAAGVVFGGTAPGDVALGGLDGAEAAAVEGVLDEDGAGVVAVLEDDAERLAGLVGGVDHGLRLFHGDGHGLLREDVAAQLQGADSHGRVQVVRQADVHDVQLLLGDHLLEVRVGLLAAEQLGACLGALLDEVAAGDQLDALLGLRGHAMERRNTATADDADSQFLLHNVRMLPYLGGSLHYWQKGTVTGRWMRFAGVVSHSLSAAGTLLARVPCLM